MNELRLKFLLLSFLLIGSACAAQEWKFAKFSDATLCLDPAYEWEEARLGGMLGTDLGSYLSFVYLDYSYSAFGHENLVLSILIRPSDDEGPKEETMPVSEAHFDDSLGLYMHELEGGEEMILAPAETEALENVSPSVFKASCREVLHRTCKRRFVSGEIEGSYSFAYEALKDWRAMELGLAQFLGEGVVRPCED